MTGLKHLTVRSLDNEEQHTHPGAVLLQKSLEMLHMFESSGTDCFILALPVSVREIGYLVRSLVDLIDLKFLKLLAGAPWDVL